MLGDWNVFLKLVTWVSTFTNRVGEFQIAIRYGFERRCGVLGNRMDILEYRIWICGLELGLFVYDSFILVAPGTLSLLLLLWGFGGF